MHEVIGEAVLPNSLFQNSLASPIKLLMKLFFLKKTAHEAVQSRPYI